MPYLPGTSFDKSLALVAWLLLRDSEFDPSNDDEDDLLEAGRNLKRYLDIHGIRAALDPAFLAQEELKQKVEEARKLDELAAVARVTKVGGDTKRSNIADTLDWG